MWCTVNQLIFYSSYPCCNDRMRNANVVFIILHALEVGCYFNFGVGRWWLVARRPILSNAGYVKCIVDSSLHSTGRLTCTGVPEDQSNELVPFQFYELPVFPVSVWNRA